MLKHTVLTLALSVISTLCKIWWPIPSGVAPTTSSALFPHAFYYIAIFKNTLQYSYALYNLDFDSSKTKQAIASGCCNKQTAYSYWGVAPTKPSASIIHTYYQLLLKFYQKCSKLYILILPETKQPVASGGLWPLPQLPASEINYWV